MRLAGALAARVRSGAKKAIGAALFVLCITALNAAQKPCQKPVWTANLADFKFRAFKLAKHPRNSLPKVWRTQQGAVFLSPEVIAVYQVLKGEAPLALTSRQESGGGGEFTLQIEFLDAKDGHVIHSMNAITSGSDFSGVSPTHDGKFIVRTGEVVRLYSKNFEELASKPLPLSHRARREWWRLAVTLSGRQIHVEHSEDFGYDEGAGFERELLDADSLQTMAVEQNTIAVHWPPKDADPEWGSKFPKSLIAKHSRLTSAMGAGSVIAGETWEERPNPLDLDLEPKGGRVVIYDDIQKQPCSIKIAEPLSGWYSMRLYAVSPTGDVAIIQGITLSLYHP